jgi:hypothetical protein
MSICDVPQLGRATVAGMGLIPRARDLWKYAPLTGREPQLSSSRPAWLIQFHGPIPMPVSDEEWIDPICVVIDGAGGFLATGPVRHLDSGTIESPPPPARPPVWTVPPLAP